MITARCNQVSTISTKSTIPNPTLMGFQARLQRKRIRSTLASRRQVLITFDIVGCGGVDRPDAGIVVCATGSKVADVGGEEDACYIGCVCLEGGDGDELGQVVGLSHSPDVDIALTEYISRLSLSGSRHRSYRVVPCT